MVTNALKSMRHATRSLQAHNELVFKVREDFLDQASKKIRQLMESAAELSLPLLVDIQAPQGIGLAVFLIIEAEEIWGVAEDNPIDHHHR